MRKALLASAAIVGLASTLAVAEMPNPDVVPWTDHTKQVAFGADYEFQHYAWGFINPPKDGKVVVGLACENRSGRNAPLDFTVNIAFRHGEQEIIVYQFPCHVYTDGVARLPFTWDLSDVIDKVDTVSLHLTYADKVWPRYDGPKGEGMQPDIKVTILKRDF